MEVGEFYYTYAESTWGEKGVWSGVHECIAVEGDKALLKTVMHTGDHDTRPFVVDRSAWYHYTKISNNEEENY